MAAVKNIDSEFFGERVSPVAAFPGDKCVHTFFMRFPIDAVFVSKADAAGARRVLSVHRNVRPWVGIVPLVRGADGVVELPPGTIDATATAVGDTLRLD